jgi:hypothetical protein
MIAQSVAGIVSRHVQLTVDGIRLIYVSVRVPASIRSFTGSMRRAHDTKS